MTWRSAEVPNDLVFNIAVMSSRAAPPQVVEAQLLLDDVAVRRSPERPRIQDCNDEFTRSTTSSS
eukprot:5643070-Pleurochrysis_carterae.AAC.4